MTARQVKSAGFTLIELMVVVAIMGVLAAIASGLFNAYGKRAKQSEARELLSAVYTAEVGYYSERNTFGSLSDSGFAPSSTPRYYTDLGDAKVIFSTTMFRASCTANLDQDPTLDIWEITDASKDATNLANDVLN